MDFETIVQFIYCWEKELTNMKFGQEHFNMSHEAFANWSNYRRENK